ncbi:autoinducer 2 ABC transporter substrate-binding protein [Treponema primitia]|uniref:autoinducer 2 ABC transporter substrate-binding protein n=1 Tax=Treponema primitia TaxID=88058 RepID=UPI00397ECD0E
MKKVLGTVLVLFVVCSAIVFEGCSKDSSSGTLKIAMMPKFKGENYFDAVKIGAQEAVDELNKSGKVVDFLYDGPSQDQATNQKQVDILEGWIAQKVSVILVSPNDPTAIAPTLKKAQSRGIKVLTFDADAQADARDLFINQAVSSGIALGLVKSAADNLKLKGYGPSAPVNVALVSSAKTDANQQEWLAEIKKLLAAGDYNWLKIKNEDSDVYYPGPDETATQSQSGTLIGRMGPGADQIQAAIGLTSMASPALGSQYEAASVKPDVSKTVITGLATPNALKSYIKNSANPLDAGVLWSCMDLGYLAIQSGYQLAKGTITGSSASLTAGRIGQRDISNKTIILGPALIFDKNNVDQFNY